MHIAALLALVASAALCADSPTAVFDKAPPQIEKALRDRVAKFFEAQVSGKFRLAEQVIHDDSQDIYYNAEKQKLISYELVKISYSEKFTKAVVITAVELDWASPRMGKIRVKPPMKSFWKLDKGEWWWYAEPQKNWDTPWGAMTPGADPGKRVAARYTIQDAGDILQQIRVSKLDIKLVSHEKSRDAVDIVNGMPGPLTLKLDHQPLPAGLTVRLSKEKLTATDRATLEFEYNPPDDSPKLPIQVNLLAVEPNQTFTFRVDFAVRPELERFRPPSARQ